MKKFIKLPLVLGLVGAISAAVLGVVHMVTDPIIQSKLSGKSLEAIKEILPTADASDEITLDFAAEKLETAGITNIYEVKTSGTTVAYGYQAFGKGYGGTITILFVVSATKPEFIGMKIVGQTETPTYGGVLLGTQSFIDQFANLDLEQVSVEVDGIAGSTVTLNAVKGIANRVAAFHIVEIEGGEEPVIKEIPDAAFEALNFPEGTEFIDVTEGFEVLAIAAGIDLETLQEETGFKYLFHAVDGDGNVLGYTYYGHFTNRDRYDEHSFKTQNIKYLFGFTLDNKDSKLYIVESDHSTIGTGSVNNLVPLYEKADISDWFADSTIMPDVGNIQLDIISGVSLTSMEIMGFMKSLIQHHGQIYLEGGE